MTTTNGSVHNEVRKKTTTVNVKAANKTEQPETIDLTAMEKQIIKVELIGSSPLIVNNFNQKSIDEMEYQRSGAVDAKERKKIKPAVNPDEKFQAARILNDEGKDCIFARWIKAALVTAAKYPDVDIPSTQLRGAVFVLGDLIPIISEPPTMRRDVVRVGKFPNKVPDLRYRPSYDPWSLMIDIEFEPKLISPAKLLHLVRRAGSSVGLCEWRPEKSPAGIYGRFDIGTQNQG
jgi:hypothetical protein